MSRRFGRNRKRKLLTAHQAEVSSIQAKADRLDKTVKSLRNQLDNPFEQSFSVSHYIYPTPTVNAWSKGDYAAVPNSEPVREQREFQRLDIGIEEKPKNDAYLAFVAVKGHKTCMYVSMDAIERCLGGNELQGLIDRVASQLVILIHTEVSKGRLRPKWPPRNY